MYEKVEQCPSCGGKNFNNELICTDHTVTKESFALTSCSNCSLLLTNPRPDYKNISRYYESEDYISHTNKGNNLTNLLYKFARNFTFRSKYKIISKFGTEKSILDYGCGTGNFLQYCKNKGYSVQGIEPNEIAQHQAIQLNDKVIHSDLSELEENTKFQIITLWHVLEHVHEPRTLLKSLSKLLTKGGRIIVAVPNIESQDCRYYHENWAPYDVPRHLLHFSQSTFKELAVNSKLKVQEVIPMKLDAYYASILSERIKTGNENYIRSFITGWKSNRWAKKNNNNYSSLIYILKK